jgi:hypothetical protein
MRALFVAILLASAVNTVSASSDNPRTKQELEQFYGAEYPRVSEAQREKLTRAAIRAQETGICNLHHVKMQKKRVPVHYGLLVFDDPYYTGELCYFPHAREYVNGGCVLPSLDFRKERAWRYVCPKCKRAQRQWAIAHPKSEWSKDILARR